MKTFTDAVDEALAGAMGADPSIIVFGEDLSLLRRNLLVRFGPKRVRAAPISESAFMGAAVAAAMGGLRPVVELYMIDFVAVAMDALLNHAAKLAAFSGGRWRAPLVVRAPCGGGYGDGGQHEQALWGWLAHIPGLKVVVPATPAAAGGLFLSALADPDPVIFFEHKLLSPTWLSFMGSGGRTNVHYDVPAAGTRGPVPRRWAPLPLGQAIWRRRGEDISLVGVGVGVHRALTAAEQLAKEGIAAGVLDLQTLAPLDEGALHVAAAVGRLLVVDEDYERFGLSGEVAAIVLEAGLPVKYGRVCTQTTIPYARHLEDAALPNVTSILTAARRLL